jgi:iron-sulfur cluster insertion protein
MIRLSQRAASEIRATLRAKGIEGFGLRVQVVGGGCEGFLYDLLFSEQPDPGDHVFQSEGLQVYVAPRSFAAVDGLIIDYGSTGYGEGFVFTNPHARTRCSCGASFGT